jgi:hypothetical protein
MLIIEIVRHTPVRVWVLLAALVAFGLTQARDRTIGLTRASVLPTVLLLLSLAGIVGSFGHGIGIAGGGPLPGALPGALGAWLAGIGAALALPRRWIAARGATWSAATRQLHVPGSGLPLALIVASFAVKYVAGVELAMHPSLAADLPFAATCSLAFGLFSGIFAARALALRRLALGAGTAGIVLPRCNGPV